MRYAHVRARVLVPLSSAHCKQMELLSRESNRQPDDTMESFVITKKRKKPNFSDRETTVLLEEISTEINVINCKFQAGITIQRKRAVWQTIADRVNAVGGHNREPDACKKRWKDLKEAFHKKKTIVKGTGGGPPPPRVPYEEILEEILGLSDLRDGVDGEFIELLI